jgi:hypothetical protein
MILNHTEKHIKSIWSDVKVPPKASCLFKLVEVEDQIKLTHFRDSVVCKKYSGVPHHIYTDKLSYVIHRCKVEMCFSKVGGRAKE